jgi:hypothetical protein
MNIGSGVTHAEMPTRKIERWVMHSVFSAVAAVPQGNGGQSPCGGDSDCCTMRCKSGTCEHL